MKRIFFNPFMYSPTNDGGGGKADERTQEQLLEAIQAKIDKSLENRATKEELEGIKCE